MAASLAVGIEFVQDERGYWKPKLTHQINAYDILDAVAGSLDFVSSNVYVTRSANRRSIKRRIALLWKLYQEEQS